MKSILAGLEVEMPKGWLDRSTLTFVMPEDSGLRDPRALQKQSSHNAANLSLSVAAATDEVTAAIVLETQVAQMRPALPGFSVDHEGVTEEGWPCAQVRFEVGLVILQWLCVRPLGDQLLLLTASASEPLFDEVKTKAEATLRSLSPTSASS